MAARSPTSSPRLPSPPPIAEDQVGPKSPGVSLYEDHGTFPGSALDNGASRRIRPGTKAEDMAEGPPLVELSEIDSAFQLTEHLKALHYSHTHPPDSDSTAPITADIARQLAKPPPNTSKEIWLYELARFLIQKTNAIIVALFADTPPCSAQTCPEMRASEWQYLCAVHDPPKSCSAIDYCCHTLDWAATTLTSSKMFPSRLGLGSGAGAGGHGGSDKVLQQQMKEITNIFRRVYRIYAHAWFQHREMFWRVEMKSGLYVFFKTVCDEYGMIQAENYTIPAEAEGLEPTDEPMGREAEAPVPTLLKRDDGARQEEKPVSQQEPAGKTILAAGDTTKRHRHTLSDRASSVSTVIQEEAEEEEDVPEKPSLEESLADEAAAQQAPEPADRSAEQETSGHEAKEDDDEEPMMGVARSDTIKAPKEEDESKIEAEEDDVAAVAEPLPTEAKGEDAGLPKSEVMEPSEAPAAEGEEAGKTVAD